MKAIRKALYAKLNGDGTLAAMLSAATAIYDARAPQSATYPLVIFNLQSGRDAYTHGGRSWEDHVWLVKAVDQSGSADAADDIAGRVDELLSGGALTLVGRTQLYLRREGTVRYIEQDGDITYRHSGATFRLWTKET